MPTPQHAFHIHWLKPGDDLADAYQIRTKVFIEEQHVPVELEIDDIDAITDHIVVYKDGSPVATGRIVWDEPVSLGRIAVLAEQRGTGLGAVVVTHLLEKVFSRGYKNVHIHAQTHARGFYERLGFTAYGEEYDDAGIPHISMVKHNPAYL